MTLHYDETALHEGLELLKQQGVILEHIKPELAKISHGVKYITSKESVTNSGLSKSEVKQIVDAYEKNAPIVKGIEKRKSEFEQSINQAYLHQKQDLEHQLATLKNEAETAKKRFPSGNQQVIGSGPYETLKAAYHDMH